ncbi:MAG: prepilin peptidase [Armatimonadetes bacterium]|nr:prepilin peptidase [Armatimonadota bacterium]
MPLIGGILLATGGIVTWTDLRWRRIPNVVTFPMMALGLALNALPETWGVGAGSWKVGAGGLLVGLGILFVSFALDLVKAGDVKYLAGVGALGGPWVALFTFLYGSLVHGALCLVLLARRGEMGMAFENIGYYLRNSVLARKPVDFAARSQGQAPYALGLAAGVLTTLGFVWTSGAVFPLWG